MRAKVQGTVLLECVVLPDGTVGDVEVVRSLDPTFGLDQEAIKAARQWRFAPGTRFGDPVVDRGTVGRDAVRGAARSRSAGCRLRLRSIRSASVRLRQLPG